MKTKIMFFLLTLIFGSYSFAQEDSDVKSRFNSSSYNTYLTVEDTHDNGLVLVLDDGSEWNIQCYSGSWRLLGFGWTEQQEVSAWAVGDSIEIQYPESGNFFGFAFLISNISKNEQAWATLKQAPSVNHLACLQIVDFDKETNYVTLNNGTSWIKSAYGGYFQSESAWEIGDAVTFISVEGTLNEDTFFLWNHSIDQISMINRLE